MKFFRFILCLFLTISSTQIYAKEENPPISLNHIMVDIGKVALELYPLIVSQREITNKEIENIYQALSKLTELFHAAEPFIDKKTDGYQVSYEFIGEYLTVVKTILQTSHSDYVRSHLYALGEICISCHTQDTALRTLFKGTTRKDFSSDYAFAELNYMTRNYDVALEYYEKYLNSSQPKTELNIIQPLHRIISIYVQIRNKPGQVINILKRYTALDHHTPETRAELEGWIKGLQLLEADSVSNINQLSFDKLVTFVNKYLGHSGDLSKLPQSTAQEEVTRVWLRGQLYHYLNNQAKEKEIPPLLYWLAVIDRTIAYNYYFSLADLYLKQCTLNYPSHPYAERCFVEYKQNVFNNYQSEGQKPPRQIILELSKMRNAINKFKQK